MVSGQHLGKRARNFRQYITNKIRMLEEEFYIELTFGEIDHFRSLETKAEVDQYAHDLLREKL